MTHHAEFCPGNPEAMLIVGCPACDEILRGRYKHVLFGMRYATSGDHLAESLRRAGEAFRQLGETCRSAFPHTTTQVPQPGKGWDPYDVRRNAGCPSVPAQGHWRDILPRSVRQ